MLISPVNALYFINIEDSLLKIDLNLYLSDITYITTWEVSLSRAR